MVLGAPVLHCAAGRPAGRAGLPALDQPAGGGACARRSWQGQGAGQEGGGGAGGLGAREL